MSASDTSPPGAVASPPHVNSPPGAAASPPHADASPWHAGRLRGRGRSQLLFGASYEDHRIEEGVLAAASEVFAIGASGDLALRLPAPDRRVTAVDVNPAQVDYVRARLAGAPRRRGAAERLLGLARGLGPAAGWTPARVEGFLALADVGLQAVVFDRDLDTVRFRALLGAGLAPTALLRAYRPAFVDILPPRFGTTIRARLRRGVTTHPNRDNPYARLLFTGQPPHDPRPAGAVEVHLAEAAAFLESGPPGTFDGFTLSNVLDGPDAEFRRRLAAAVAHAGTPDAPVVLRTLREPPEAHWDAWAARDRSLIWGGVLVTTAATFPEAVERMP